MTWLWRTCFSAALIPAALAADLAVLRGSVELKDSRNASVRKRSDYSGVVVSLTPAVAPAAAPVAAARAAAPHAIILQKDKTFRPHLLAIATGSVVDFPNADPIFHNAFSSYSGQVFDIGLYPPGTSRSVRFARPGVVRVFCNIHPTMSATIVVLSTPYFTVTSADGNFAVEAPAGTYQMRVYHDRATEETLGTLVRTVQLTAAAPTQIPAIVISESGYLQAPHKNKHGQDYGLAGDDRSVYPGVRK